MGAVDLALATDGARTVSHGGKVKVVDICVAIYAGVYGSAAFGSRLWSVSRR